MPGSHIYLTGLMFTNKYINTLSMFANVYSSGLRLKSASIPVRGPGGRQWSSEAEPLPTERAWEQAAEIKGTKINSNKKYLL